ncbi:hypothetical protein JUN65_02130 [Gluconacetobacter azotocaptans]|uniref:glycine-rich domain-containing protein n=1 Tax=Gluconacetobacter azotocaptans TaxID=142834 RepID=UPI00195DC216|nr:hypothetical protein [Gluconacetobacter azotocaptans]MBM9400392.1 hypothetical protein [Gluconacetobacter azotocaptans]
MAYQIDGPGSVPTMPVPAAAGTPGYFTGGNPAAGLPATVVQADFMNCLMMEVVNFVVGGNQTPDKTKNNQMLLSAKAMFQTKLGWTPVQQGGGLNQGTNKIILGLDATGTGRLRYQVDTQDYGDLANYADVEVEATRASTVESNLQSSCNTIATSAAKRVDGTWGVNTANGDQNGYGLIWGGVAGAPVFFYGASAGSAQTMSLSTQAYTALVSETLLPIASSQSLGVPSWASRVELICVGGGAGGANCNATSAAGNMSGAGGGSGEYRRGVYPVTAAQVLNFVVGGGGGSQSAGGTTSVTIQGQSSPLISANGGTGGIFASAGVSAGGGGGVGGSGGNILSVSGSSGSDGQNGTMSGFGNGGNGPWGGGGRAGAHGGQNGSVFGAGGGGAYDANLTGSTYLGGNGAPGIALFRFLP